MIFFLTINPFGFTFDSGSNVSKDPATNVANLPSDKILHGAAGNVDGIAFYNGASITIDKSANSTVKGIVYLPNYSNTGTTGVMVVSATYGNGRVVGVGDSSVSEDDTAHDSSKTYPGWDQPFNAGSATGDDGVLITNATLWLSDKSSGIENIVNKSVAVYPNPAENTVSVSSDFIIKEINIYAVTGKKIFSELVNSKSVSIDISSLNTGVYFIDVIGSNNKQTLKLFVR